MGRGGHELQQWLKGLALTQKQLAKTVQEGCEISNVNDAEPCLPDVQCSVGLRGYQTNYPSDVDGAEPDFPVGRSHTTPNPKLYHDAERETLPRRSATTRVPRHTEFCMMGGEAGRMDGDGTGDTVMGGREERGAPGCPLRDGQDREEDGRHPHEDAREVACGDGAREDHCHCRHVDFLIGS